MIQGAILALFLTAQANAQTVISKFCGQVDAVDAAAIDECAAQDALNVESNATGTGLRKRDGYEPVLTVSASAAQILSVVAFKAVNGNECTLTLDSAGVLKRSVNNAAAVQVSTFTAGESLYCAVSDGLAYCYTSGNGLPFSYDCSTFLNKTLTKPGYPNGKFNVFIQDRQLVAGTTDFLNRLHLSKSGTVDTFTTGINEIDAFTENIGRNGDKITGLAFLNGRVIVFKEYSIGGFNVTDQFNSVYYDIAHNIGVSDPGAWVIADGALYLKASDNHIYVMDGSPGNIKKLSGKIEATAASLLTGKARYVILTEQSDWDGGNYNGQGTLAAMSGSITPGSILPSSITLIDTSASDFSSGTLVKVSTTDSIGSVTLSSTVVEDNFGDGNFTSNPAWSIVSGGFVVTSGYLWSTVAGGGIESAISVPSTISSGTFRLRHRFTNTGSFQFCSNTHSGGFIDGNNYTCLQFDFAQAANGDYLSLVISNDVATSPGNEKFAYLLQNVSGTTTTLTKAAISSYSRNNNYDWRVDVSSLGQVALFLDGVFISSSSVTPFQATKSVVRLYDSAINSMTNFYLSQYLSSGTVLSRIFDTGFSTPTAGPLTSTVTFSSGETAVYFDVRNSTSPNNDLWTAFAASSATLNLGLNKRYWQYRARFWTQVSTKTPSLEAISLLASTTGQYITQCVEPGSGISSWGTLEAAGTTAGAGNFTFANSTGTSCSDPGINTFTATSTGTTISIATGAAYKVRVTFGIGSASDTARLDSLTVNWNEGSVAPPSYATYWNGDFYFAVSTGSGKNNRVLKYEPEFGAFYVFDIGMNSPINYNNNLYFGSTSNGKVYRFSNINPASAPTSDDGAAINAYWRSKSFSGGDPFSEKSLDRISLVARKQAGGTISASWRANGGATSSGSYTVTQSTGYPVVNHNYMVPVGQRVLWWDYRVGNNSTLPFEILGVKFDIKALPWRVLP